MVISILDYGMGNLRSVLKGFEKSGCTARIISSPADLNNARALVVPGVGAFRQCLQNMDARNLITPLLSYIRSGRPFMGICLGLQLLFSRSEEFGDTPGLDVIRGRVTRFCHAPETSSTRLKIPHMGWNTLSCKKNTPELAGVPDGAYMYFVHSYYVEPDDPGVIATTTPYGVEFVSSICRDNIFACQFHPEKSQAAGLGILKNFARRAEEHA
jgi:imidazole glycerol-phosphate synthase subunit HisH